MRDYIEYTADHEEPMCHRCDNVDMPDKWCVKNCGGANWWSGYRRTEKIVEEVIIKNERKNNEVD